MLKFYMGIFSVLSFVSLEAASASGKTGFTDETGFNCSFCRKDILCADLLKCKKFCTGSGILSKIRIPSSTVAAALKEAKERCGKGGGWFERMSLAGQAYFNKFPTIDHSSLCYPPEEWGKFELSKQDEKVRIEVCNEKKVAEEAKIREYYESPFYWKNKKDSDEQKALEEAKLKATFKSDADYQKNLQERREKEASKEASIEANDILREKRYFVPNETRIRKEAEFKHAKRELAEQKAVQKELDKNKALQKKRDKALH